MHVHLDQTILDKLERIETLLSQPAEKEYMTIEEAAGLTTFSASTLYDYVNRKIIPFTKKGGKLIFQRSKLQAWLEEGSYEPVQVGRKIGNKRVIVKL